MARHAPALPSSSDLSDEDVSEASSLEDEVKEKRERGDACGCPPPTRARARRRRPAAASQVDEPWHARLAHSSPLPSPSTLSSQIKALKAATGAADSGDEEASSGEEGGGPHAPGAGRPADRAPIYDAAAMADALEDIAWPAGAAWAEGRVITSTCVDEVRKRDGLRERGGREPGGERERKKRRSPRPAPLSTRPPFSSLPSPQVPDPDNDLARELAFHAQALAAAHAATAAAAAAGVPWARPADYYAEMVKSDGHMARVRAQLDWERGQIDGADERRKAREAKQYAKQVQAERKKEKTASRKAAVAGVSKLRADRKRSGFADAGGLDAGAAALDLMDGPARAALGRRFDASASRAPSAKRAARDTKYGFGGRANAGRRRNDAASAADMRGYKPGRFDDGFGGKGGGGGGGGSRFKKGGGGGGGGGCGGGGGGGGRKKGGGGGAAKRPGKARRAAARGGR